MEKLRLWKNVAIGRETDHLTSLCAVVHVKVIALIPHKALLVKDYYAGFFSQKIVGCKFIIFLPMEKNERAVGSNPIDARQLHLIPYKQLSIREY